MQEDQVAHCVTKFTASAGGEGELAQEVGKQG